MLLGIFSFRCYFDQQLLSQFWIVINTFVVIKSFTLTLNFDSLFFNFIYWSYLTDEFCPGLHSVSFCYIILSNGQYHDPYVTFDNNLLQEEQVVPIAFIH